MFVLPEVPPYHLRRAPLVQALVQIRFPMLADLQSVDGIARLQDRLGDRFPYLNQRSQQQLALQFQIGPEASRLARALRRPDGNSPMTMATCFLSNRAH